MKKVEVSPSILSANFLNLEKDILDVYKGGAKYLHFDVMDGHFVPNISFGSVILKQISKAHLLINDVHLMITDPDKYLLDFINSGADIITFHYEAESNIDDTINLIKASGVKVGMSIKPGTRVESLIPYLSELDLVLIMSVEPGFGGQKFILDSLTKLTKLKEIQKDYHYQIMVDGGINQDTIKYVKDLADVVIIGSVVAKSANKVAVIKEIKSLMN